MASLQAVINPPVQEVMLGSTATFSCLVYDSAGHESTRSLLYEWEAAPYIVQEQRYTFSDDKHTLEIYDVQISDNNTSVWCRGGPSNKAKARILVVPSFPGNKGMATPTTQPMTSDALLAGPAERRSKGNATATIASLLIVFAILALLLVFAYRKLKKSRRYKSFGISSKLLGHKFGSRKSRITRCSGGEDPYQEPVIPAFNNPPQYTCLTQANAINKRPIPPPRTKRGRRNTDPASLCAIVEEEHGYNTIRPCSADPPKAAGEYSGYMDMSGKRKKGKNPTLRRAYSQYDDADDDYENINIRTISNQKGNQTYVNQNVADKNKGHLPSHSSGKPRGRAGGTLVYASLDLGEIQGGQVFAPPAEGEKTTYAKILRILSVFRTMRSTRIRVLHTGADGKHARGQCDTTRYR